MSATPTPLFLALVISYAAFCLIVTTTLRIKRLGLAATRWLLWTGIGLGALSLTLRTAYFLS